MPHIHGIVPALLTPFDAQGRVHEATLSALVNHLIAQGIHGLFVTGGTGEGLLLEPNERKHIVERVLAEVNGRIPVITHVGAMATHVAADLADHAAAAGATAVAAIPPIYFPIDQKAIVDHYHLIAQSARGLPVWVYHIPHSTGVNVTPTMLRALLEIEQIKGIKYTAPSFGDMRVMIEMTEGRDFTVMSGPDELCLNGLVIGASGAIGTSYNLLARHFVQLYESFLAGDLATAQMLQFEANRIIRILTSVPVFAALKLLMTDIGFDCGVPRRPLRPLDADEKARLYLALKETKLDHILGVDSSGRRHEGV